MKEWKASHRLVDKNGLDIGETVMKEDGKYYTRDAWYHYEQAETDASLKEMGWFTVSSFRDGEE